MAENHSPILPDWAQQLASEATSEQMASLYRALNLPVPPEYAEGGQRREHEPPDQ